MNQAFFGRPGGNRTHNLPLGGESYIHLTTDPYSVFIYFSDLEKVKISFRVYGGCTFVRAVDFSPSKSMLLPRFELFLCFVLDRPPP